MEISIQGLIILILGIIFVFILYQYHYYSKIENIVSSIDNSVKIFDFQRESGGELTYNIVLNSNNLEYNPAADDDSMVIDAGNDGR